MRVDVVLGLQWGDEGKGKVVDVLAHSYEVVARFQGGPNAGHTLYWQGKKIVLHQIPAGIFHPHVTCLVGDGCVIDPGILKRELLAISELGLGWEGRFFLGRNAHLILPTHKVLDKLSGGHIGTTQRGIGPAYADRYARRGIPIFWLHRSDFESQVRHLAAMHAIPPAEVASWEDFWEGVEFLRKVPQVETPRWLSGHSQVLAEGSQGSLLDIFWGTYPYVTSSHTTIAGVVAGLGVAPQKIRRVYGVLKAYTTRVGEGPFPTEIRGLLARWMQERGGEWGSTTGRLRRCGWLDLPTLQKTVYLNGVTDLILTKADVLCGIPELKVRIGGEDENPSYLSMTPWENLDSEAFYAYIRLIEKSLGVPLYAYSTGPEREAWRLFSDAEAAKNIS